MQETTGTCAIREILERARRGDRGAFALLVKAHLRHITLFVRLRFGELTQSVPVESLIEIALARAFRELPSFRGRRRNDFYWWLSGIVEADAERLEAAGSRLGDECPSRSSSREAAKDRHTFWRHLSLKFALFSESLDRSATFRKLESATATLNDEKRCVFLLALVQRLPVVDIAERLACSEGEVARRFLSALRDVRPFFSGPGASTLPETQVISHGLR